MASSGLYGCYRGKKKKKKKKKKYMHYDTCIQVVFSNHHNVYLLISRRNYEVASEDSMPEIVRQCVSFLRSEAMFLTLSNLTGLKLHALAPDDSGSDDDDGGGACESDGQGSDEDGQHSSSGSETTEKIKPKKKRRKLNSDGSDRAASRGQGSTSCLETESTKGIPP